MSRILLTWELGLNLGHLTRLLPMAQELQDAGHTVLVAARNLQAAATVLGPVRIPFVQAPHLPESIVASLPTGYADILLSLGWSDSATLYGLTHAWLNLVGLFRPERMILDYSPSAGLAARIAGLPVVLIGNGFELPPPTDPLPPFPGFSWATPERAARSENIAVENANKVLAAFGAPLITALRDLVAHHTRICATFPELDHYGERADSHYIGPLLGKLAAPRVDWPEGDGPRLFASLRPDTCRVQEILSALSTVAARVVCVVSGFSRETLQSLKRTHIRLAAGPVDLQPLLDADLCITYGAEGTMLTFLLAGVPQLISPMYIETFMAARRMEANGYGMSLPNAPAGQTVADTIETLATDGVLRGRARDFAHRKAGCPVALAALKHLSESAAL
jgi:UDP:flavonoid glycosyltransferase YjiC (YdhE family)